MNIRLILLWLIFVPLGTPASAQDDIENESLRVYFIGNSVTDTIRYESFATLAESRDQSIVWGRHMIPGAPLEWIHSHADSGFMQEPFGHYPKALGEFLWDAVSVQPFDRQLHSNDADGDRGDVAMICDFAERAAKRNPDVQIYIYARWPRITSQGKGVQFDKNDYDPTKPGSGADLSRADTFADRWTAKYTGEWDATNETRDYFDQLLAEVRKETLFLKKPPLLVPVGEVMFELDRRMRDGKVPGYTSVYQLYKDAIHLGEMGSYLVGCTFYATMMRQSSVGLPTEPYGKLDPKVAAVLQQTVWDVVSEHLAAGVLVTESETLSEEAMKSMERLPAAMRVADTPRILGESRDRVAERNVGTFSGGATANEWTSVGQLMQCCVGNAGRSLYYVWEHSVTHADGIVRVNLLLNRASPWADLQSHIPFTGKVEITLKSSLKDLLVRAPQWLRSGSEEAACSVNGEVRPLRWQGRYFGVGEVKAWDVVAVTFPIAERVVNERIGGLDCTLIIKGSTVVRMEPGGTLNPLYQREHYRQNETLWVRKRFFTADSVLEW